VGAYDYTKPAYRGSTLPDHRELHVSILPSHYLHRLHPCQRGMAWADAVYWLVQCYGARIAGGVILCIYLSRLLFHGSELRSKPRPDNRPANHPCWWNLVTNQPNSSPPALAYVGRILGNCFSLGAND